MNQRSRSVRTVTVICAVALLAVTLVHCQREAPASPSPTETSAGGSHMDANRNVRTEKVALTSFRRTIETTGTVAFDQNRSTQVLSPISGPVARILVAIGSRVGRDEPLATVASPDFAADVSALRKAEATARNTRRIADLDRDLFKNDAISRRDMEQAETDALSAEADRDSAIQQLRALGVDEKTMNDIEHNRPVANLGGIIRSPISGTVVEKFITPGQLLQASATPCFTVADLSSVWVMANLFEADLPFVAAGDSAEVITGSGQPPLPGRVEYIAALVDPNTRAVLVRLGVPNPGEVLKRDLYVRVAIHSRSESRGLLIPVSAVLRDEENLPFVFVAGPDGTFARRRVQIGARIGDRQEISSGLAEGQTIVVEGGLFLGTVEHP
jgi:cobalt-zinc-cadmium efflux system membrane fusion protein